MSREKLEKDFQAFNAQIDKLADEELKNIKEKANAVREEANRIGQTFEPSVEESKTK